jgi:proline iminopeptidase
VQPVDRGMTALFPPIEPHDVGYLDTADGHSIWYEVSGNPRGAPAVILHGGPGSGISPGARRFLDPRHFRIIAFDQRGAGKSTPNASNPVADLSQNTTHHLVSDMEQLCEHLGAPSWLVMGGSWGSTLALKYALEHRERCVGLVLYCVATTGERDIEWTTRGVGRYLPEAFEKFRLALPPELRDGDMASAYARLLNAPDPAIHERAAADWCDWEQAVVALHNNEPPQPRFADKAFRLRYARLVTHYFSHRAWLRPDELIERAPELSGIPVFLIHGRLDLGSPLETAWMLHKRIRGSVLHIVSEAGHDMGDPGMTEKIVEAANWFRA